MELKIFEQEDMKSEEGRKSYTRSPLSKKEIEATKGIMLELIEKGKLETTEVGKSKFPTGLFLLHHPRYIPKVDGKVHGLRIEGGEILSGNVHRYPPPIQKDGQQQTTCAVCGKDVLLHIDFRSGDVPMIDGAFCLDCVIGHPERRIPITFVDKDLRFKTVYKANEGAYITNEGVMRSYAGEQWRKEYDLEMGDSIGFYRVVEDSSGLFTNKIFVKAIKRDEPVEIEKIEIGAEKIESIELAMNSCIENIRNAKILANKVEMRKDKITVLRDKIDSLNNELNIENTILEDEKRKLDICKGEIEKGERQIFDMVKKYMQEKAEKVAAEKEATEKVVS